MLSTPFRVKKPQKVKPKTGSSFFFLFLFHHRDPRVRLDRERERTVRNSDGEESTFHTSGCYIVYISGVGEAITYRTETRFAKDKNYSGIEEELGVRGSLGQESKDTRGYTEPTLLFKESRNERIDKTKRKQERGE